MGEFLQDLACSIPFGRVGAAQVLNPHLIPRVQHAQIAKVGTKFFHLLGVPDPQSIFSSVPGASPDWGHSGVTEQGCAWWDGNSISDLAAEQDHGRGYASGWIWGVTVL